MMPSEHSFKVGGNIVNFFAIGDFAKQDDFFAIGYFRTDGSFVIDAKLYSSNGQLIASIKNNEVDIKGNLQQLNTIEKGDFHSLEVIDAIGTQVLYAEVSDQKPIVEINGKLFDKSHQEIAIGTKEGLVVHKGKAVLGATKRGSLGFVMNCSEDELAYIRKFAQEHLPEPTS
jgi:hypothetical protein